MGKLTVEEKMEKIGEMHINELKWRQDFANYFLGELLMLQQGKDGRKMKYENDDPKQVAFAIETLRDQVKRLNDEIARRQTDKPEPVTVGLKTASLFGKAGNNNR